VVIFVSLDQATLFQKLGNFTDDGAQDFGELFVSWCLRYVELTGPSVVVKLIDTIEEEHMEVHVKVDRPAKSLDQCHTSGFGGGSNPPLKIATPVKWPCWLDSASWRQSR